MTLRSRDVDDWNCHNGYDLSVRALRYDIREQSRRANRKDICSLRGYVTVYLPLVTRCSRVAKKPRETPYYLKSFLKYKIVLTYKNNTWPNATLHIL